MLPNLSRLKAAPTGMMPSQGRRTRGAVRRAREQAMAMPEDLWKLVMEKANEDLDRPFDICRELDARCSVAKTTPWGENACGEYGWMYDQANQQMGFYRDYPDWNSFKAGWIANHPEHLHRDYHPNRADWWTQGPKTYFRKVCDDLYDAYLEKLDGTYNPFVEEFHSPWARAFQAQELREHPRRIADVDPAMPDYVYLAKVALSVSHDELKYVAGSLRWNLWGQPVIHNEHLNTAGFVEIAKVALRKNGLALRYIPGSLDLRRTHASTAIPEYAELARIAVQQDGLALRYVPGTPNEWGNEQAAPPIPEYLELAKLAVQNDFHALEFVPGARILQPNGVGTFVSVNGGVNQADFVAIVNAALQAWPDEADNILGGYVPQGLWDRGLFP